MAQKQVVGTRPRRPDEVTLKDEVSRFLQRLDAQQEAQAAEQVALAEELGAAEAVGRQRFRFASRAEIEEGGMNLARRLRRESEPTPSEVRAAMVLIMDAEDQRRILFEQRTGVRTPNPVTGASSLDDPRALENLAKRSGVGGTVPGRGPLGNIQAFFGPGGQLDTALSGSPELQARRTQEQAERDLEATAGRLGGAIRQREANIRARQESEAAENARLAAETEEAIEPEETQ